MRRLIVADQVLSVLVEVVPIRTPAVTDVIGEAKFEAGILQEITLLEFKQKMKRILKANGRIILL